jgi:RNA polymerase sigma factor (sigma-70 family)
MSVLFLLFALLARGPLGESPEPPPDEAKIREAIEAARQGDRAALAHLYGWHVTRVFRALRPSCRNDADAEDLTQETFVKAFSSLDRYEPRPDARFVSWLLAIALNTARKSARRLSRVVPTEPESIAREMEESGDAEDAGTALELARLRDALLAALADLGDRERFIVCLRYGGELDVTEVAELTGASQANVRKICERQRKRILAWLAARGISPGSEPTRGATA